MTVIDQCEFSSHLPQRNAETQKSSFVVNASVGGKPRSGMCTKIKKGTQERKQNSDRAQQFGIYQSVDGNKAETEAPWRRGEGGGSVQMNLQRDLAPTLPV